jgi:hypothetical protein
MRSVGTGFGSLGGASILFLSVMLTQGRLDIAQRIAIDSFATALPLLVFTTVAAYSLSLLRGSDARTKHTRRAFVATVSFGLLGALGVVVAIAASLWHILPFAAISFAGCAIIALVVYIWFTWLVTPRRARA